MPYVRFPLSLRNVEDLLFERGIDVCHETVRLWWNRFGPLLAADIRRQRVNRMRDLRQWRWHLDEVSIKINDEWLGLGMIPRIIRRLRTCGAPLTMKAKSWSSTSPRNETNLRLCAS